MTDDEIAARLIVLEVFVMNAMGLYLSNSKNDPDYAKAAALIELLRDQAVSLAVAQLSPAGQAAARAYSSHVAGVLAENLRTLRGEGGKAH